MLCWYWNWGSERIKDGTGIWTLGFLTLYHMLLLVCIHAGVLSHFSHVQLCAILWTVACQAPLFMGEYCSGKNTGLNCHALQPGIFWLKVWTVTSIVYPISPRQLYVYESEKWKWKSLSCVWLSATPWAVQSMEFLWLYYVCIVEPLVTICSW